MEVQIAREELLRALESVKDGLAPREIIEQSTCFVFTKGEVITYNGESSVRGPSGLPKSFTGAVQAQNVLELLRRLEDEGLLVALEGDEGSEELVFRGKGHASGFTLDQEVRLPYKGVEPPGEWKELPEEFTEAVGMVQACAGRDGNNFKLTCVNLAPKWVEACDEYQACRWRLKTGLKAPVLVKRDAVAAVTRLGSTEFSETEGWVHFRNPRGFVLSCRRYVEEFPSAAIDRMFAEETHKVSLPKGLEQAAEKANLFSSQSADINMVEVDLRSGSKGGRVKITGRCAAGWYSEVRHVPWSNGPVVFMMPPTLLGELVKKYNEVSLSESVLKIEGGAYTYATMLASPPEQPEPAAKKAKKEKAAKA